MLLKPVVSETVRNSTGIEKSMPWTRKGESTLSELGTQPRRAVARRVQERTENEVRERRPERVALTVVGWTMSVK